MKSYVGLVSTATEKNSHTTALKALAKQFRATFIFEEEILATDWIIIGREMFLFMLCVSKPSIKVT